MATQEAQGWFPQGSQTSIVNNVLTVQVPSGWTYVGYDNSGALLVSNSGKHTVSCTCNNGSGKCDPFVGTGPGGGTSGCAGGCTDCSMKQSIAVSGGFTDVTSGGYLNMSIRPYLLKTTDALPGPFSAMYDYPPVQQLMNDFLNTIYQGKPIQQLIIEGNSITAPDGYYVAAANIGGRSVPVCVPADAIVVGGNAAGNSASCSCTAGSCVVKSKTILIGGVTYCDGNCTGTCSLTMSMAQISQNYSYVCYLY